MEEKNRKWGNRQKTEKKNFGAELRLGMSRKKHRNRIWKRNGKRLKEVDKVVENDIACKNKKWYEKLWINYSKPNKKENRPPNRNPIWITVSQYSEKKKKQN